MSGTSPLYDDPDLAAAYARVTAANVANAAYERPAMRALLGDVRGLDVLDAGCAAGEHSAWLAERGARVVALDASETMVRLARERLRESARVLQADLAQPLPFADASFDIVVSSLTLHYLEDWTPPLRELARVLRPARTARALDASSVHDGGRRRRLPCGHAGSRKLERLRRRAGAGAVLPPAAGSGSSRTC